jgi:hypothetical protein
MSVLELIATASGAATVFGLVVAGVHAWREAQHKDREVR